VLNILDRESFGFDGLPTTFISSFAGLSIAFFANGLMRFLETIGALSNSILRFNELFGGLSSSVE
jgi:hypothetical protein